MSTATDFIADVIKRSDAFADFAIERKVQDWFSIISSLNLSVNSDTLPLHWILRRLGMYFKQVFKCFPDYTWMEEYVYSSFWNRYCMKLALQSYCLGYATTQCNKTLTHRHEYLHCLGFTLTQKYLHSRNGQEMMMNSPCNNSTFTTTITQP